MMGTMRERQRAVQLDRGQIPSAWAADGGMATGSDR